MSSNIITRLGRVFRSATQLILQFIARFFSLPFSTAPQLSPGGPLYLGLDLSTQQLKAIIIDSQLKVHHEVGFGFDVDAEGHSVRKGVLTNEELHEVYAPVAMWLQAVDVVMERLKADGLDFSRIKAISGAGQQHGSVYWSFEGERALQNLNASKTLEHQLDHAFSHPYSPNWQDASTQAECDLFDKELSSEQRLACVTGSKAHHVSIVIYLFPKLLLTNDSASRAPKSSASNAEIQKPITGPAAYPSYPPGWPLSSSPRLPRWTSQTPAARTSGTSRLASGTSSS